MVNICTFSDEYCSEPGMVDNGFYMCKPNRCALFKVGTEVDYICNKHYEPRPHDVMLQVCLPGGKWASEKPVCAPGESYCISSLFHDLTRWMVYCVNVLVITVCLFQYWITRTCHQEII